MNKISEILYKFAKTLSDVKDHPLPNKQEGLFSGQSADKIVKTLLRDAKNDVGKAIEKLTFYINRGGEKIDQKEKVVLNRAKKMLEEKLKKKKK